MQYNFYIGEFDPDHWDEGDNPKELPLDTTWEDINKFLGVNFGLTGSIVQGWHEPTNKDHQLFLWKYVDIGLMLQVTSQELRTL